MHVLMISLDTEILSQKIGNSRLRHEAYAEQVGQISLVVCNRRTASPATAYESDHVIAHPTNSHSYFHYLLDGYRLGLKLAKRHPVNLITSQDPFLTALIGLALRRKLKVPLIIQDHSSFLESEHFAAEKLRNRLLKILASWTLPRADAVRVVNNQEKQGCIRRGISADRVCVIPVVPDIMGFAATRLDSQIAAWREKLDLDPAKPVVLWTGRPAPVKNLSMLIRAFAAVHAECPDVYFVLAGDMTDTSVPAMIAECGLSDVVRLPGAIPHSELPALYQAASIYTMSSNYEGLPVVLLEASAAALPIVSTRNNGALDLIRDGENGILVPIGDDQALAQGILDVLRNPERAKALGMAAQQHVLQAYDEKRLMMTWVDMWRSVAAGRVPCASS